MQIKLVAGFNWFCEWKINLQTNGLQYITITNLIFHYLSFN